jgi:sugar lactone lactonase YvrE
MTIDNAGNIYTANWFASNVSKITPNGTSTILGSTGTHPVGIAIDNAGNIYTANTSTYNVSKITTR